MTTSDRAELAALTLRALGPEVNGWYLADLILEAGFTRNQVTEIPVDELLPLSALAEELGVSLDKIQRWADPDRRNNFPKPVEVIGRVKFYKTADVRRWCELWNKTRNSKTIGNLP